MRSVSFKGVWYGLSHGTRRAALGYAVIEGVAFALLDGYRALQAAGTNVQIAFLVGGGSKSCYWTSSLANALRLPLLRQSGSDLGAALGAARLGMMASNPDARRIFHSPRESKINSRRVSIVERLAVIALLFSPSTRKWRICMTRRSVTHLLGFAVASLSGVVPTPLFADQGSEINSTLTAPCGRSRRAARAPL